jgi:cystathionine beta-lyase/cystathionine gamma-synthase
MDISYILNQLGEERESYSGSVVPPTFQTTNFCFNSVEEMRKQLTTELEVPFYTRGFNPTVKILRQKLAALEQTEDALVFSSGSAAVAAAVMSVVSAGDHIVCVKKPYSWTSNLITKYLERYGVQHSFAADGSAASFEKEVRPNTKLIYLESPNSLTFEIQDIRAIAAIAASRGITTIIDNSYNSPLNQNPATMGIDLVVHSGSKYINGHSDVVCGVVCGSRARIMRMMAQEYMTLGAIISPVEAGLILRGLRTLELRVDRSAATAQKVFEFLKKHPKIAKVYYPFDPENTDFDLAKSQMKQGGGLLSIQLKASSVAEVEAFCNALKHFLMATSWGGYESLIFPLCALAASKSFENPLPWDMVRLYIGLEDPEILIQDLSNALDKM